MAEIHKLSKQFSQYFVVALIGLGIDFSTLVFLKEIVNLNYLFAAACGFTLGLYVVYNLSNRFVFSNPKINSKKIQFLLFGIIGLAGLGILSFFMWILTEKFGLNYIVSKIFSTVFVYLWNFIARRSLYEN